MRLADRLRRIERMAFRNHTSDPRALEAAENAAREELARVALRNYPRTVGTHFA
jgi:hypothetical protein